MQIILFYVFIIFTFSIFKRNNAYLSFQKGVHSGIHLLKQIFPPLLAFTLAINLLEESNFLNVLKTFLSIFHVEPLLFLQCIIKPLSSSNSTYLMLEVFHTYGVDSKIGFISSILESSSDTTLYIMSLYFSSVGITNYKYALKVGLLTDIITFVTIILFSYFVIFCD